MKLNPQFDHSPSSGGAPLAVSLSSCRPFPVSPTLRRPRLIPLRGDRFAAQPLPCGRTWRASGLAADITAFRYQTKWSLDHGPKKGEHWTIDQYDYYGLRMYDAQMGRFISRDPIGEAGGMNLYAAFGNDPVNNWAYLGLSTYDEEEQRRQEEQAACEALPNHVWNGRECVYVGEFGGELEPYPIWGTGLGPLSQAGWMNLWGGDRGYNPDAGGGAGSNLPTGNQGASQKKKEFEGKRDKLLASLCATKRGQEIVKVLAASNGIYFYEDPGSSIGGYYRHPYASDRPHTVSLNIASTPDIRQVASDLVHEGRHASSAQRKYIDSLYGPHGNPNDAKTKRSMEIDAYVYQTRYDIESNYINPKFVRVQRDVSTGRVSYHVNHSAIAQHVDAEGIPDGSNDAINDAKKLLRSHPELTKIGGWKCP